MLYPDYEFLKEPPKVRKRQKNIKHSENITFDETVNIAWQMQHRSLARELSRTIKAIPRTAQSVGCSVDGCHPQTSDGINSGVVECPARKGTATLQQQRKKKNKGFFDNQNIYIYIYAQKQ